MCAAAAAAAAAAKSLQSCPTLWDPIDGSPWGSPVPGILQARTLEWVAISFSNASKWKVKVKSLSCVQLLAPPWTAVHQAPLSMGFSSQEYWSGVPLPSPSVLSTVSNPLIRSMLLRFHAMKVVRVPRNKWMWPRHNHTQNFIWIWNNIHTLGMENRKIGVD